MASKSRSNIKELFVGKYNYHYLYSKAERDLERLKKSSGPSKFHDALFDFAIDIKVLLEWYWHDKLKHEVQFAGKSLPDFIKSVKNQSGEYLVFDEIANTVKHHTRNTSNKLSYKIQLRFDPDAIIKDQQILIYCLKWKVGPISQNVLPVLTTKNGDSYKLLFIAEKALEYCKTTLYPKT